MKPQALQDAIKNVALKKKEKGEWKDPYVKKYTITKEDYLQEKQRFNPTVKALEVPSSSSSASAMGTTDPAMLQQMKALLEQMQAERYDWRKERDSLVKEMDEMKFLLKGARPAWFDEKISYSNNNDNNNNNNEEEELGKMRNEINDLKVTLEKWQTTLSNDIESLREDLSATKSHMMSIPSTTHSTTFDSNSELESLRKELQSLRLVSTDLDELKGVVSNLKSKVALSTKSSSGYDSDDVDELKEEITKLKKKMITSKDIDDLRKEITELQTMVNKIRSHTPPRMVMPPSESRSSPKTPSGSDMGGDGLLSPIDITKTPLKSPYKRGKEKSTLPSCKPHTVQEMSDGQRKDKLLKEYLRTRSGLPYLYKNMSIPDYLNEEGETKHLVCFDNRLYIPKKLRKATMEYYVQHHPYDSYTAMERHCIWPDCEDEMKEFKKNRN